MFIQKMLGLFGRDGKATKIAEDIPVVGLFTAGAHALAGNEEQAKRAAMKSKPFRYIMPPPGWPVN